MASPKQAAFLSATEPVRGFVAGQGSGKSKVGAYDLLQRVRDGRTYMVTGPTYKVLGQATIRTFVEVAREFNRLVRVTRSNDNPSALVRLAPPRKGLAEILFRSTENPDHLRGPNLSGLWMDEASLSSLDAYQICVARLREGGKLGWLSATFTPRGRMHWTFDVFGRGKPGVFLVHARTDENPFVAPEYVALVKSVYQGARARQELGGEFTDLAGAEFPPEYFDGAGFWFSDWPQLDGRDDIKVMALDPAKGADAKLSDYQAIILFGRDRNGTEYVQADLAGGDPATSDFPGRPMVAARAPDGTALTDGMVERTLELYSLFRPETLAIEVNQMQLLLVPSFKHVAPIYRVCPHYTLVDNRKNKHERICRLGQPLSERRLRFHDDARTRLLVDQLREYSLEAAYDDGPDALEQARRVAMDLYNGRGGMRSPSGWRV